MLVGWSARQTRPRDHMHELSEAARFALAGALDPDEKVDIFAPAVGSIFVLTDRRLILVPTRSGVPPEDRDPVLRPRPRSRGPHRADDQAGDGRVAGRGISVFIRREHLPSR